MLHHWRIALLGLLGTAIGIGSGFSLSLRLLPLTFFGIALFLTPLVLLIRSQTLRVAYVTLFLFVLAEFAVWTGYAIHQSGKPLVEGKSDKEVRALFEEIQNGMSRQDIATLFGSPKTVSFTPGYNLSQRKDSVESWTYYNEWRIMDDFLRICFDADGKVVDKYLGD